MGISNRERIVVGVAALMFFAVFGAVAYYDRDHGAQGDDFGQDDFSVVVEKNQGHLTLPDLPADLLIFGPGQNAVLDFTVTNNDEDNDIDTIYITIPGAQMVNATIDWYDTHFDHEWDYETVGSDMAKLSARDDLPGRVFGGSAQYDVAGNIDDALDHNTTIGISEGLTVNLEFTTPTTPGTKVGSNAIDLEVADEQTESGSGNKYSVDPFPYPFMVVAQEYEFMVFEVEGADLDIEMGGQRIFNPGSRASDFTTSQFGYKYISNEGNTVVVLDEPIEGTIVNPIIIARDDQGGQFTINMMKYATGAIDPAQPASSWINVESSQTGYTGDLPGTAGETLSLDIDGDGLFTDNDGDIDGDGVPNDQDSDPYNGLVINHIPTVQKPTASADSIAKNKALELEAIGNDQDGDTLAYAWSVTPDNGWTGSGPKPTVDLGDFEPGTYLFTVTITDGEGGMVQDSVTVEVTKAEKETNMVPIIIGIVVVILVIIIIVAIVMARKGEDEGIEMLPLEEPPEMIETIEEPLQVDSYEAPMFEEEETYPDEYAVDTAPPVDTFPVYEETIDETIMEEETEDEISDLESLIGEMEEMEEEVGDECPECGGLLGPFDTQCSACGAQFEVALECPGCGAVVEENVSNCPGCGTSFE